MDFTLHVWRQPGPKAEGKMATYPVKDISPDSSFFEMMDMVNYHLLVKGEEPIALDYDCLEGICGNCSLMINGIAHGPEPGTTTCQLHMRSFKDGDHIYVEPWRAKAFPVIRDLVVDRSAFDRILQAGGFVSVNTGGAPDANAIPISKEEADLSMDAAQCIGCGACVASCKNASAMLFVGAKVAQFAHLPQGKAERTRRVLQMIEVMDKEGFGNCTNFHECEAVCPKEISVEFISEMNREYLRASIVSK
ncbi:MAG: succinate dehydrogenase/fumarate reductase iron-sulfur subunit [Candidatus Omnitrophota bacterium]|jgi:succinate dehydrogenase / fumarate reductase iron-sulfur subunit|nr:MAG: succinate dehydrogenase/fumarate reductase iron-sulfur subunit [Candidatus Omnitrophota bacterium]